MVFKKPCRECGEIFQPTGKFQKLCDNCMNKRLNARNIKNKLRREMSK